MHKAKHIYVAYFAISCLILYPCLQGRKSAYDVYSAHVGSNQAENFDVTSLRRILEVTELYIVSKCF